MMNYYIRNIQKILIAVLIIWLISIIVRIIPGTEYIYHPIKVILTIVLSVWIILFLLKIIPGLQFLYKPIKIIVISTVSIIVLFIVFLIVWYNCCFFPNDQDYLHNISDSVEYKGKKLEEVEIDLIRDIKNAKFKSYLSKKDREFLLDSELRNKDIYIDENPYWSHSNNLKYSTGRIFYYTYQKNSIVLKANSDVRYTVKKNDDTRFLEFDAVFPQLGDLDEIGIINLYFTSESRKLLLKKKIEQEKKPHIRSFRYSDILSSIIFYIKNPGRSVLTNYTGWEKIRVDIPSSSGDLEIEFKTGKEKNNYLFIGSPVIYSIKDKKRNNHVNIVYLLFDLFSKNQIDLYEYYNEFSTMPFDKAVKKLRANKIITPVIDRNADRICLFENMHTAGQVTRPSIVALWTSQIYTRCRMPVFRNIVTKENKREFYNNRFTTLSNELSKHGYFTKQISCNAQGHGVSGVGADLGFDENYDYTMEATEKTENFRRIIEFLNENQNRKFFLYSHINIPHTPRWIPAHYFFSSLSKTCFNIDSGKIFANIKYLNDSLGKVMNAIEKLHLMENTMIVITADHCMSRTPYLRGEEIEKDTKTRKRESQKVADYYSRAIYARGGHQHLLSDYMNIPWILIKPDNLDLQPGKIDSFVSSLDISPTLLDIALNKKESRFSGESFKDLLTGKKSREKVFNKFIPMVGRFQNGFILDGRYKYYINLLGMYKYREENNKRYLMQQEYLYDLQDDPGETDNLVKYSSNRHFVGSMRNLYFERFIDYPDKNFFQISPSDRGETCNYIFNIKSINSKLIYPKIYGQGISYKYNSSKEIIFKCTVTDKPAFFSFETDPSDSSLAIAIYKNGKLMPRSDIFSTMECINYFNNPIILNDRIDFHIARYPGKTGLEVKDIPAGSVFYSRIPLIYWMEMSLSDKDIKLSPGIKEVLRGWGYIQ